MSHRSYRSPRHGSMGFYPRKRSQRYRGKVKSFPTDDSTVAPHLTAFLGYKAGMTHILRDVNKPGSKIHKKEVVEPVTIIETPNMIGIGLVGYVSSPRGLRNLTTVFASYMSEDCKRRFYRRYVRSKKKAYTNYTKIMYNNKDNNNTNLQKEFDRMKKYCTVVRLLAHTQPSKLSSNRLKKGQIMEIQINGGSIADKVEFGKSLFEKEINISSIFKPHTFLDVIGVTTGHGYEGSVTRFGVATLPRKTHRGLRRVACIGAWHPARVRYTCPRAGQHGFHHRTEVNKRIYLIDSTGKLDASTEFDLTTKTINPLGGFPHYGVLKNPFIMLKGSVMGPIKRLITLRHSLAKSIPQTVTRDEVNLKFIDTSSKMGHGRFQTHEEKVKFYGPKKKKEAVVNTEKK